MEGYVPCHAGENATVGRHHQANPAYRLNNLIENFKEQIGAIPLCSVAISLEGADQSSGSYIDGSLIFDGTERPIRIFALVSLPDHTALSIVADSLADQAADDSKAHAVILAASLEPEVITRLDRSEVSYCNLDGSLNVHLPNGNVIRQEAQIVPATTRLTNAIFRNGKREILEAALNRVGQAFDVDDIIETTKFSRSMISLAMKDMENRGWLRKKRDNHKIHYQIKSVRLIRHLIDEYDNGYALPSTQS